MYAIFIRDVTNAHSAYTSERRWHSSSAVMKETF